jgi:hypothetical protein
MNQSALLRPDWTPATIALMILGFVVFWPLGLAMLAYIIFGERLRGFKRDANRRRRWILCRLPTFAWPLPPTFHHRQRRLRRLAQGRARPARGRTPQAERNARGIRHYARELRRAKDQEEFDRFMRDRKNAKRDDNGPVAEYQTP